MTSRLKYAEQEEGKAQRDKIMFEGVKRSFRRSIFGVGGWDGELGSNTLTKLTLVRYIRISDS